MIPYVPVALAVVLALLVAVTVIPLPAELGAVNVAVVAVTELIVPLDAVHVTPALVESFATVAVIVATCPMTNPPALGVIVTVTPPAVEAAIVMVALADFVLSSMEAAVSVIVAGFGIAPGAVYVIGVPDALVVADKLPHVAALHPEPDNDQATPSFEKSAATVAVKGAVASTGTVAVVGDSETEIAGPTVTVAVPDFVVSLIDVAVIVTVAGVGAVAGAV